MKLLSFEKSVGAVVFRLSGTGKEEFLLLHYPSGHWDFPKGHIEDGETEEETLRREVEEETGLADLEILPGYRSVMRYFYRAKGREREKREKSQRGVNVFKKVVYYIAEAGAGTVSLSEEHTGSEWLGYEQAVARVTFRSGKDILRKARIFLDKTR